MGRERNYVGGLHWNQYTDLVDRHIEQVCGYQDQLEKVDLASIVVRTSSELLESVTAKVNSSLLAMSELTRYRFDMINDKLTQGFANTQGTHCEHCPGLSYLREKLACRSPVVSPQHNWTKCMMKWSVASIPSSEALMTWRV